MKIATVFSGIGAIEEALKEMNIPFETVFACDNGERYLDKDLDEIINGNPYQESEINQYVEELYANLKKPNYVKQTYYANHNTKNTTWFEDIRFIDGKLFKNKIDMLIGGSPCQSFSIIGKRAGLEDTRGTLFYDFARLVDQTKPKVFIFENVKGMLMHDKGKTWKTILEVFHSLDYNIHYDVLNSKDYGIPQNRSRLFVIGFKKNVNFDFPQKIKLKKKVQDYLEIEVPVKYYLGKKGFEFVTNPKYKNRAKVDQQIMSTQKANQQFNWNGDFIFEPLDLVIQNTEITNRAHIGYFNGAEGVIRKLTPRECLNLMGFSKKFKIVVPDKEMYRQAGNSIVVSVLKEIMKKIMEVIDINA